eukprot:TRINITY_DN7408_c0_g1_i2.p1 TRINITY_DN7408_c0_g1~~TRINITY_DN7408_c0_g1_i2.p1  ORF type:complete len:276 (-),score=21.88 TRINITY_DN7408_c0_g1_i2:253-1080(-)
MNFIFKWFRRPTSRIETGTIKMRLKTNLSHMKERSLRKFWTAHDWINKKMNIDYFVHIANVLGIVAMGMTDMILLRFFLLAATVCGVAYNIFLPRPLLPPAAWGVFFTVGHSVMIIYLLRQPTKIDLSPQEMELYEQAFMSHGFTPYQFANLIKDPQIHWQTIEEGTYLTREGDPKKEIWFLLKGKVNLYRHQKLIRVIYPAATTSGNLAWIGDFGSPNANHPEENWSVSSFVEETSTVVAFPYPDVKKKMYESEDNRKNIISLQLSHLHGNFQH